MLNNKNTNQELDYYKSRLLLLFEKDRLRLRQSETASKAIKLDCSNTRQLKQIISEMGYPTISLVGIQASRAAWVIIQHSTEDIRFMEDCLIMMKEVKGDLDPQNIAFLEDRILTIKNLPQIYGTQYYKDTSGSWQFFPIEDLENVDYLRREIGLCSLDQERDYLINFE